MRSAVLATLALLGACSALEHKGAEATLAPQPSLVIVSVDNRDFTSAIQYAVRYAGSLPVVKARAARTKANVGQATSIKSTSPAAEPLTSTHYPLASSLSAWTKALYCQRHGYTFRFFQASTNHSAFRPWSAHGKLHGAWLKPLTLLHMLRTTPHEFVLLLDGDVVVRRQNVSLAPLLKFMRARNRHVALGLPNAQGHNSGVLLVRNSAEGLDFVHEWWDTHRQATWLAYATRPFWEQTTLNFAILAQPRYSRLLVETDLFESDRATLADALARHKNGTARAPTSHAEDRHMSDQWWATNRANAQSFLHGIEASKGPLFAHFSTGKVKNRVRRDHELASEQQGAITKLNKNSQLLRGPVRKSTQSMMVLEEMMRTMATSEWVVSLRDEPPPPNHNSR